MALSEAAKRIGDMPAFPCSVTEDCRGYAFGMSYRQWLIGQVLAGGDHSFNAVHHAGMVLEQLAAEQAPSSSYAMAAEAAALKPE